MDDDLADTVDTYEAVADEYRRRHADREAVAALVDRFLAAMDDPAAPASPDPDAPPAERPLVIDAGCGPGWETATFVERGCVALGIDPAGRFLRMTRQAAPTAAVARGDMRAFPVADGRVDGLWACASFLHVPRGDAPGTLAEFHRVLRPGAPVQLSVKHGEGTVEGDGYEGDRRRFTLWTPDGIRIRLEGAGFGVEDLEADGDWIAVTARK